MIKIYNDKWNLPGDNKKENNIDELLELSEKV